MSLAETELPHRAPHSQPDDDSALIAAVRAGDLNAYGALYERHVDAVRRLAKRLCSNRSDVDDVTGEVFTNTLRALRAGRGPDDALRSYLLTATRHTVIKLQTRSDGGHTTPIADPELAIGDRGDRDDPYRVADTVEHAFVQLPDRFQNVLWLTCVEGVTPHEVGARTDMKPGAVTSLCLRARRALARQYLLSRVNQPERSPECHTVRELLPGVLRGEAAMSTIARVDAHVEVCDECEACKAEMGALASSMRSGTWLWAVVAWARAMLDRVAAPIAESANAAAVATAVAGTVAAMALTGGDTPIAAEAIAESPVVEQDRRLSMTADRLDGSVIAVDAVVDDVEVVLPVPDRRGSHERVVPEATIPVVVPPVDIVTAIVDPVVDPTENPVSPIVDPVVDPVDPVIDPVVDPVVDPIADPIVDSVQPVLEPILEPLVEQLVQPLVEQVVEPILDPVLDPVTEATSPLLQGTAGTVEQLLAPATLLLGGV